MSETTMVFETFFCLNIRFTYVRYVQSNLVLYDVVDRTGVVRGLLCGDYRNNQRIRVSVASFMMKKIHLALLVLACLTCMVSIAIAQPTNKGGAGKGNRKGK
jgi:hypothetical protein